MQLLSRIGDPVAEPLAVDVVTTVGDPGDVGSVVDAELDSVEKLTEDVIAGRIDVF